MPKIAELRRAIHKIEGAAEILTETGRERLIGRGRFAAKLVEDEEQITANRRFISELYVKIGKLNPEATDSETGLPIEDAQHDAGLCNYVSSFDSRHDDRLTAVGKLIWKPGIDMSELRMPFEQVNPDIREYLESLGPGKVAELGGLAKLPGTSQLPTLSVQRKIYAMAEAWGVDYMVAGVDTKLWPKYKAIFGSGIELMHPEDGFVTHHTVNGPQKAFKMNVHTAYEGYFKDTRSGNLGLRARRMMVLEYFANEVPSFEPGICGK